MIPRSYLVVFTLTLGLCLPGLSQPGSSPRNLVHIDASAPVLSPETGFLHLGGKSSNGHDLEVNSRYLVLDGKPWLPVMGEIHYTRIPEDQWEAEILKMKAGGIDIVSTYVFWIHHEEIEGQFDWTGRRNLRHFVELCAKHGMYVYLRPGPWAHGEARNGGFPDWLVALPNTRSNDPAYLAHVSSFFNQIGEQLHGLMWKDGGPVIGTQLENEYPDHGPGRGAEHILRLKQLAIQAGIDPPLFSVTGWPSLDFPPREVLPVSGGYPDGFWFGSQTALPPNMNYLFNFNRQLGDMGATVPSKDPTGKVDLTHDPYFAAEQGGGMATSYHRRPVLSADDIAALTLTNLGAGVNLYGYYMAHGGINPPGKLTTLQESQATGFPNDLPQIDYDFQAPIGAFGQIRDSYRKTRLLHLFLNAYGSQLAPMPATVPTGTAQKTIEQAAADNSHARVAVRTDGASGFLFVNNYVRQLEMPARPGFQVSVQLAGGELRLPDRPVDLPANSYFFWPFNLALGSARLRSTTAQLLTRLDDSSPDGSQRSTLVFFALPGIEPEFCFDAATLRTLDAKGGHVEKLNGLWRVDHLQPGLETALHLTDSHGKPFTILLLTESQAEHTSVVRIHQRGVLALTDSDLFQDGDSLHLLLNGSPDQQISFYPASALSKSGAQSGVLGPSRLKGTEQTGHWLSLSITQPPQEFSVSITQVQSATPRATMAMGPPVDWRHGSVPQAPEDSAFQQAAIWELRVDKSGYHGQPPSALKGLSQLMLDIQYTGDIAHLESQGRLLDDNFYNGRPWQVGLKSFPVSTFAATLKLKILPMPAIAPIYLDDAARLQLQQHPGAQLLEVRLIPQYESVLTLSPKQ
jgi:hypothetical protein